MNRRMAKKIKAWDKVSIARHKDRPTGKFYIDNIFDDFIEFHGDRNFGDDKAIIGGIAEISGKPVTVISITKGENTKENIERNFGMPKPEGYRKALRLMKQAEKFKRPIICLIDTPGAFCGIDAEERGQGQAIAENLAEMMTLKVPIISIIIGEGGSGGAIALAKKVVEVLNNSEPHFKLLYNQDLTIKEKIDIICKQIYRANSVVYTEEAEWKIKDIEYIGYSKLPICMAKTPLSFSDDPNLIGAPRNFKITIRDVNLSAGAGFIVALTGKIMTMPGLPAVPAAVKMEDEEL